MSLLQWNPRKYTPVQNYVKKQKKRRRVKTSIFPWCIFEDGGAHANWLGTTPSVRSYTTLTTITFSRFVLFNFSGASPPTVARTPIWKEGRTSSHTSITRICSAWTRVLSCYVCGNEEVIYQRGRKQKTPCGFYRSRSWNTKQKTDTSRIVEWTFPETTKGTC